MQLEADEQLDIPAGARDFVVKDNFRLPLDADALAVYPHAHYLGKLLEAYATLPDGSRKWLIRIPDWNPAWQAVYYYREPVFLPKGTVVSMRYHYDNSAANIRNPHHPPRRVEAGNQSTDEMAHLWLQLLPRGASDRRRELQEAVIRHRLEKNPRDFTANFNLGAVMLSRLDAQGAVSPLKAAVAAAPRRPEARNMLGVALQRVGRNSEALAQFEIALKLRSAYTAARFNLANAQIGAGKLNEAIENLRQVVAADPSNPLPKNRLKQALAAREAQSGTHSEPAR
ncbi:MAG TPA: tetratricopeptide repeat protein [Bryobacteraceae bacterium]|nr:tetratricopeptide repeat protein [Bryobacteraceae bacterium]